MSAPRRSYMQSAVSQRIKQLENMFGQPLLVRTVPRAPPSKDRNCWLCCARVELLEEEWLGDEQTGSTPLLLSLAVNADSLATAAAALANVLSDSLFVSTCRWKMKPAPGAPAPWRVVGAVSIQPQALPSCTVDQLGALDYLFVASKSLRNAISRMA